MSIVYISIGSNLGNRRQNIQRAICQLEKSDRIKIKRVSSLYETEPIGFTDQPDFLNCVVEIETDFKPLQLLKFLKEIERSLGRKRDKVKWRPRVIDLDIILYDQLIFNHPQLIIPHKEALNRRFVLVPLAEIAPQMIFPHRGIRVQEALESSPTNQKIRKL